MNKSHNFAQDFIFFNHQAILSYIKVREVKLYFRGQCLCFLWIATVQKKFQTAMKKAHFLQD